MYVASLSYHLESLLKDTLHLPLTLVCTDNHQKILRPLRYKTHQPEENGIVEQTLLTRGGPSQSALSLEHQLTSNDIILVMSLRPGGVTGTANPGHCHNGNTNVNVTVNTTTATAGIIANGPWDRRVGMEGTADVSTTPDPGRRC